MNKQILGMAVLLYFFSPVLLAHPSGNEAIHVSDNVIYVKDTHQEIEFLDRDNPEHRKLIIEQLCDSQDNLSYEMHFELLDRILSSGKIKLKNKNGETSMIIKRFGEKIFFNFTKDTDRCSVVYTLNVRLFPTRYNFHVGHYI